MAKGIQNNSKSAAPKGTSKSRRPTETKEVKVGSDRSAAEHFGGGGDFGIPAEGAGKFTEVAEEAKFQPGGDHLSDPRPPRSGGQGTRESGVGGVDSGPGSSSGGDLDTDLIGVGTHGAGVSIAGPDDRKRGPDMTEAGSEAHHAHAHQPKTAVRGSTVDRSGGDNTTTGNGTGTGTITPTPIGDDAAAGEISQGEAGGDDNTDIDNLS